jgi:glycosyltransferase involved in cell wall biosynthesis
MGFLQEITPVLLTLNEAPNLERTLARLAWARDLVVVDSGSGDATAELVRRHPGARLFVRPFDDHAAQWRFALEQTGIATPWVLRLDADYVLTEALVAELDALAPPPELAAYRVAFTYCVGGRPLRGTLYPPNTVLFRHGRAKPWQDGHTERWRVDGPVAPLKGRILHDDRKPVGAWLAAQARYQARERDKLLAAERGALDRADRLRLRHWIAPWAVFLWCLFGKGLILDGRAGLTYAYQRLLAETALALYLLDARKGRAP